MRIKEVEERTGLTAKAIRLYEAKGLLSVARETENDYRDYSEEDVKRLKMVAVLRQLDIPIKVIKEWAEGKRTLRTILEEVSHASEELERENLLRRELAQDLCQALENRPEEELPEILEDATELQELINELAGELEKRSLMFPVWMTVTGLGPILMTVLHVFRGEKDQILIGFVLSLIAVVGMAFTWHNYLTAPKSKRDNSGCLPVLLCGVLTLVGMFGLMIGLQSAQMSLFVPNEQMIMLFRAPWCWLILLLELEMAAVFVYVIKKPWKEETWKPRRARCVALTLLILSGIILYGSLTGVSVATEDGIVRHSFFNPKGEMHSYDEIVRVEAGFKGKFLGIPVRGTGEFYYRIIYSDGTMENWKDSITDSDEMTYEWLVRLDKKVMAAGAEKISSEENVQYCYYDQEYVDIILEIIRGK